ncbi:MAG: hypothetical protein V4604_03860 [Bacteroidota bacterium]
MKKTVTVFTISALFSMACLMSCSSPSEKLDKAQEEATEANEKLEKAEEAYLRDIEEYKQETAAKIAANEQMIADFSVLSEKEKKENLAEYQKKIDELRAENEALKVKMENYRAQGNFEWQEFKQEFNEQMLELGRELNDFRIKRRVE